MILLGRFFRKIFSNKILMWKNQAVSHSGKGAKVLQKTDFLQIFSFCCKKGNQSTKKLGILDFNNSPSLVVSQLRS